MLRVQSSSSPAQRFSRRRRPSGTALALVEGLERRQLLSSTVAYWRFENGAVNTAAAGTGTILDSSGHGFNGTPVNGPVYSSSVPVTPIPQTGTANKRSLSFNGTNQRVAISDNTAFQLTQSLTLEAYIDARASTTAVDYIVFRGDDRAGWDPYWLGIQKNAPGQTQAVFEICSPAGPKTGVRIAANISLNRWTYVAGTLNNATGAMDLYVNGQLAASTTTTSRPIGALTGAKPGLGIGNVESASYSQYFNGLIDEVRISNAALLPNQLLDSPPVPFIQSFSASPNPAKKGQKVTLTANVADFNGTVTSVSFYRESNGKAGLQTGVGGDTLVGTDTSALGGWSVLTPTIGLAPGTYTYYARATDNKGAVSNIASTTDPVVFPIAKDYSVFWNGTYTQTSSAPPSKLVGYFFTDRAFLASAGDFDGGTLKFPGSGSPKLGLANPTLLQYATTYLSSRAALDAAFPFGTYTTTVTSSSTGAFQALSMSHTQDAFSASIPALTAATYNGMQGMNSTAAFTFNFNSFITGTAASQSYVFFTLTNTSTNQAVFSQSFLSSKTTSVLVPAKTLLPKTKYQVLIDFSNRIDGAPGPTRTDQGFDLFTNATFTTA